ncbi:MAG: Holliday junction resolvase RecU [Bacilli bacterium]|nr:Holliday junction resolvase RecU [Bacilli bacterium]
MKYPGGIKKIKTISNISYKNRGMSLENDLNDTNDYYRDIDKAYIYKKPTPIKITKVDYPSRDKTVIKEAFFTIPSTTDYNGLYKGKYIDFEAKETKSKSSFPLANIHPHQIEHIRNIFNHEGIVFLIVRFTTLNKTFLLLGKDFLEYIDNNTRKSIPINYFEDKAYLIKDNYNPRVDYLKIIDNIIGGK